MAGQCILFVEKYIVFIILRITNKAVLKNHVICYSLNVSVKILQSINLFTVFVFLLKCGDLSNFHSAHFSGTYQVLEPVLRGTFTKMRMTQTKERQLCEPMKAMMCVRQETGTMPVPNPPASGWVLGRGRCFQSTCSTGVLLRGEPDCETGQWTDCSVGGEEPKRPLRW